MGSGGGCEHWVASPRPPVTYVCAGVCARARVCVCVCVCLAPDLWTYLLVSLQQSVARSLLISVSLSSRISTPAWEAEFHFSLSLLRGSRGAASLNVHFNPRTLRSGSCVSNFGPWASQRCQPCTDLHATATQSLGPCVVVTCSPDPAVNHACLRGPVIALQAWSLQHDC